MLPSYTRKVVWFLLALLALEAVGIVFILPDAPTSIAQTQLAQVRGGSGNPSAGGQDIEPVVPPPPPPPNPVNPNPPNPSPTGPSDPQHLADGVHILFVDKNNAACNDTAARTAALNPSTPWCSPAALHETTGPRLQAGDTVYFRGGEYVVTSPIRVSASRGTSGARITLKNYPGESVTIRGGSNSTSDALLTLIGVNYLSINGLNFLGSLGNNLVAISDSGNLEVRDSVFRDFAGTGLHLRNLDGGLLENIEVRSGSMATDGLKCDNCRNITLRGSRFGDVGHVAVVFRNSANITIERNSITNRLHTGINILAIVGNPGASSGTVIRNNTFTNTNQFPSQGNLPGNAIQIGPGGVSNMKIYNNLITDGHNGARGIGLGANLVSYPNSPPINQVDIFYNTIVRPGADGIYLGNSVPTGQNAITNVRIYNNIIADAGRAITLIFENFRQNNGYGVQFKNNLIKASGGANSFAYSGPANGSAPENYTPSTFAALPFVASTVVADPLLDGSARPRAGSPALGAGLCLGEVAADFDGRSRPSASCDIGAFQSNLAATTPPPSATSTPPLPTATTTQPLPPTATTTTPRATTTVPRLPMPPASTPRPSPTPAGPTPPKPSGLPATRSGATTPGGTACAEHWLCRESWSACLDGKQTRECVELSRCGTTETRPAIERSCASATSSPASSQAITTTFAAIPVTPREQAVLKILVPTFLATLVVLAGFIIRLFVI